MNLEEIRRGAAFQVQTSRDGQTWIPRQPAPDGIGSMIPGGDHWFDDHHSAWVAANQLRCAFLRQDVRIAVRNHHGDIVGEQIIE